MSAKKVQKISPYLWFAKDAEQAARFYASIFPDSRVDLVSSLPAESPSGPAGSVEVVEFTLCGERFFAMGTKPMEPFNHAISLAVTCEDQAELDRYWKGLLAGGGKEEACGWVKDRYGVSWQIMPARIIEWISDRERARRVAEAMLEMIKLDFATLEKAYGGR